MTQALRPGLVVATAAAALAAALVASLALGAVRIPLDEVIDALLGTADADPQREIVLRLRLPRRRRRCSSAPRSASPARCCRGLLPTRSRRPT